MSYLKQNIFFYEPIRRARSSMVFPASLKFNKDIKMLPSLSPLHIEYRIRNNGLPMVLVGSAPLLVADFWKWLRPEFKRGQISCSFQGSGRSRIMRFIGVLRNAAKTGDEYPNGDRLQRERERERVGNWSTKRRNSTSESIFVRLELLSCDISKKRISCSLRTNGCYPISLEFSRDASTLLAKYKPLTSEIK